MHTVVAMISKTTQLFWKHKTHAQLIITANVSMTINATEKNFLFPKHLELPARTTDHVHGLIIPVGRLGLSS